MAIENSRSPLQRLIGNRLTGGASAANSGGAASSGAVRSDRTGPPPENAEFAQPAIALVDKPRRRIRPIGDPLDLEAAFARLASLLALGEPHQDAPRGYYINILV